MTKAPDGKDIVIEFVGMLIVSLVLFAIDGFVFKSLWLWFVVPIIPVRALSLWQAVGFSEVIHFLNYRYTKTIDFDWGAVLKDRALTWCVYFTFGWLIHRLFL